LSLEFFLQSHNYPKVFTLDAPLKAKVTCAIKITKGNFEGKKCNMNVVMTSGLVKTINWG
jgi:hypothetical protein